MKKHLITLMLALACILALAVCVSAKEYTVTSNSEYQAAYASAVNGDTLIVNGKLTCDIQANKSITYVLKADWESSKLVVDQSNVEVSFIADGGNYKIMPTNYSTTQGWLNIAESYENVVINFGGKNGGTITIDGSNATHDRVTYVEASAITLNLLKGSAIANFNTTTKDDNDKACILYAKTVNMYDGCQIYGNRIISAPLIKSNDFNLFGGEIFGNLLTSTRVKLNGVGFIYAHNQFTMCGGRLYDNVFNATNGLNGTNAVGFISVRYGYQGAKMVVLGGEIGNTYVSGNGGLEVSAMFGINNTENATSYFYYNTAVKGTRYKFTDTPALSFNEQTGKATWKVNSYTVLSENWNGWCWKQTKVSGDKVAVFLNASKKSIAGSNFDTYTLINAYIDNVYAHSGSNVIAIPSGYELWSTSGTQYCHDGRAYTLSEVNSSSIILYSAYNAGKSTVNGEVVCAGGCGKTYTCSNPDHDLEVVSIKYTNYSENGVKEIKCNTCGYEDTSFVVSPALFTCLGYSVPEDGRGGISIGYTINNEAIKEYEKVTGKTLKYGVFAVAKEKLGNNDIFASDGAVANSVISAEISSYEFVSFALKIVGFTDEYKELKLALGTYVAETDGTTTEYSYIQAGTPKQNEKYCFVSYNDIVGIPSTKEEVAQ